MGEFVVDITGLDAFAKELTTFSDTLSGHATTFTWTKPDTGRWAAHNSTMAQDPAVTTKFADHVSTLVTEIAAELGLHATYVSECVTAYNMSDASVSAALTLPPVPSAAVVPEPVL